MLIYLHGFRSSPLSEKARILKNRLAERGLEDCFWCRELPVSPREAIALVEDVLSACKGEAALVGSSLGGYYAAHLAEKHDLRAVLINPAAHAARLLEPAIGPQTNLYTGLRFDFTARHVAELEAISLSKLSRPRNVWLLVETGDEVLDYREAVELYADARQTVIKGGDHGFRSFPQYLDEIIDFACGRPAAGEGATVGA